MPTPQPVVVSTNAALPNVRPVWLVAIELAGGTLRLSSRGEQTFGGNTYTPSGIEVSTQQIRLTNAKGKFTASFRANTGPLTIDIWQSYGPGPFSDADWAPYFSGEIGPRSLNTLHITGQLRSISSKPEPHLYVVPSTFRHLPPRGTVIHTPTGRETLPSPPSGRPPTNRPPQSFDSPTIPGWVPPVANATTLNETQGEFSEVLINETAEGSVIPYHFGPFQFGPRPYAISHDAGTWTVGYLVGVGEIEAIDQVWINGEAPVAGVSVNTYIGQAGQSVDPLLEAAIEDYVDDLVHVQDGQSYPLAHVVIQWTNTHYPSWPSVVVQGRGMKLYNPATGLTAYSESPALVLRHFIKEIMGEPVNEDCFTTLAATNAQIVQTLPRRLVGLTLDRAQSAEQWLEVLRTYACAYYFKRGRVFHACPDRPVEESSIRRMTPADFVARSYRFDYDGEERVPTVVNIEYTDTSTQVWTKRTVPYEAPGVSTGAVRRISSTVRLPGVQRASQARREGRERQRKLGLNLRFRGLAFDQHMDLDFGDVVELADFEQLGQPTRFRITAPPRRSGKHGNRVELAMSKYDPAVYDDTEDNTTPGGGVVHIGETTLPGQGASGITPYVSLTAPASFTRGANGGAWSHTTCDATFRFKQDTNVLATHVVRITLDTNTGTLSAATQGSPTGDATTLTAGSPSASLLVTVSLDAEGIDAPFTFHVAVGGSQGSPGTSATAAVANWGGQWGAFGDIVAKKDQLLDGTPNDGETVLEGADGGNWFLFAPGLESRTGVRLQLNGPWEADVSAELTDRDNTIYYVSMAQNADVRFGVNFPPQPMVTATFEPTLREWKAYPNLVEDAVVFTPQETDVIFAAGYKSSTTGGIDRVTMLTAPLKMGQVETAHFFEAAAITTALIKDASIVSAKIAAAQILTAHIANAQITDAHIVNLNASKITAGLVNAARLNIDGLSLVNSGGTLEVGSISAAQISTGLLNAARINLDGLTLENNGGALRIGDGGVDTTQIANEAVSVSASATGTTKTGNGTWQELASAVVTLPDAGNVPLSWSISQGYGLGSAPTWGFRLKRDGAVLPGVNGSRSGMTAVIDQIAGSYTDVGATSGAHTYSLEWNGVPNGQQITAQGTINILGLTR